MGCRNLEGSRKNFLGIFFLLIILNVWKISYFHEGVFFWCSYFLLMIFCWINEKKIRTHCTSPNIFLVPHRGITLVFFFRSWMKIHWECISEKKDFDVGGGKKFLTKMPQAMPNIRILMYFQTWKKTTNQPVYSSFEMGRRRGGGYIIIPFSHTRRVWQKVWKKGGNIFL